MLETNPFPPFVPKNCKYLLVGSFGGRMSDDNNYDWYYGTKRNKFWYILSQVYKREFSNKEDKQRLFSDLKLGVTDIILSCERKHGTNLDNNLVNIVYNIDAINNILKNNKIERVYFSSKFVEKEFKKVFKEFYRNHQDITFFALPSPSPRYAAMSLPDKIKIYKKVLPKLNLTV